MAVAVGDEADVAAAVDADVGVNVDVIVDVAVTVAVAVGMEVDVDVGIGVEVGRACSVCAMAAETVPATMVSICPVSTVSVGWGVGSA